MKILALDPATKTGFCLGDGMDIIAAGCWDLSPRRDESKGMRLVRLRAKLDEMARSHFLDLMVFESARHAAPSMQGALVVQAELQGVIKLWGEHGTVAGGFQYRGYSPSEVKKHATGKGNAPKESVMQAARERWPGIEIVDDNQADAMWLWSLAASEYATLKT